MGDFLLKGLLIGLIFGVPAGAIGALTIQRSLNRGFFAGLITGLGSSVAELIYACIGVFGITLISEFLTSNQLIIRLIGGVFVLVLGIFIFFQKKQPTSTDTTKARFLLYFLSAFLIAILNPAIILSFFVALTSFGISGQLTPNQGTGLILGIFIGTLLWWAMLSGVVAFFRSRVKDKIYQWLNYILGGFLIVFGLVVILQGLII